LGTEVPLERLALESGVSPGRSLQAYSPYPDSAAARDRWILERRSPKRALDPNRAYASVWEEEPDASGAPLSTAVLFLTNRECPFRCAMCDLWMHTLDATLAPGAIPRQIAQGLAGLPRAAQVKLYNAGSFFDPRAIPPDDDAAIAGLVGAYSRVIVEAHPAFLRGVHAERCLRFRDRLRGRLEVAVGLETAEPATLERLNKRMTLDDVAQAAGFLRQHDIDLRVFVLLHPPFIPAADAVEWACRSVDLAAAHGAVACTVIPTRGGNGAMEALDAAGSPRRRVLADLERVLEYGLATAKAMRVFADLWDVDRLAGCRCAPRVERLRSMNREQRVPPPVVCACEA